MAESHAKQPPRPGGEDLTGTTVGRFAIRERLGGGGMGEVYRADDTKLNCSVALKRVSPQLRADPRYRQRLHKEAERAARLRGEAHIATIFDVLEQDSELFIVMEYVEGETLRQRLARPLPLDEFLKIAVQCTEGLVAAHEQRLVHRDIKPENIMLTPARQVKILDFGVAKSLPQPEGTATTETGDAEGTEGTAGGIAGTPGYMAPEVLLDRDSDGRADIFSLGVVCYEALTGKHPFWARSRQAIYNRSLHETPLRLMLLNPKVPAELERIVTKMLAKPPEERYATAADLLVDLRRLLPGGRLELLQRQEERQRRRRWLRWVEAAGASLVLAGILVAANVGGVRDQIRDWLWPFQERDWILVADFENQTNEPLFDRTVSTLLQQALRQSRYVNVVPRSQVLQGAKRMGRTEVAHVDAALGRQICQREGYRALLAGEITTEITAAGSTFHVVVQVVNPQSGDLVITETETLVSPQEVYAGMDRLARRLRSRLGESLALIEKSQPLAKVTTPSLEALQRYSRAMDLYYAAADYPGFVALAERAVELDPDFAMAHHYLALAYNSLGNEQEALEHLEKARQGLDRVTDRERHLILGSVYSFQNFYEQAVDEYRVLIEFYPDDVEGQRGLAGAAIWTRRPEEAIRPQRRARELAPRSVIDHHRLMDYLVRINRFEEALEAFAEARALGLESPSFHWAAGLAQLGLGRVEAARREFQTLHKAEGGGFFENLGQLYLSRILLYEGRLQEATDALRTGLMLDQRMGSETWTPVRFYLLATTLELQGRIEEARVQARRLQAAAGSGSGPVYIENLRRAGLLECRFGDLHIARQLLERVDQQRTERDSAFNQSAYYHLTGVLELAEGNSGEAIQSLQASVAYFPGYEPYPTLARALAAQGDWQGALDAYEQVLVRKGMIFHDDSPTTWVLAHLEMARLHQHLGNFEQARQAYDEFLRLWANADEGLPVLQEARAEREQLSGEE